MKRFILLLIGLALPPLNAQADDAAPHAGDCHALAKSRLGLYVHSDMYPLSDREQTDALNALFEECMKPYRAATAAPAPEAQDRPPVNPEGPAVPFETKAYAEPPKETGPHPSVAAPVSGVSMQPVSGPPQASSAAAVAPDAPAQSPLQAHSPFKVAAKPSPEVAQRIREASSPPHLPATPERPAAPAKKAPAKPPVKYDSAADPTGRAQLQSILNQ